MLEFSLPESVTPGWNIDGVLHRLLVGPATFIAKRPPIIDGGRVVMPYTNNLEAAAALFDTRLSPSEWVLFRGWDHDHIRILTEGVDVATLRTPRGRAAAGLSLLVLAVLRNIKTQEDWETMIEEIVALSEDTETRRNISRMA